MSTRKARSARSRDALLILTVVGFGCLLRCLHLLDGSSHFIVSPDSHFFFWMADAIQSGSAGSELGYSVWTLHSGLAYPLAYCARMLVFVFGLEPSVALIAVAKFMPPVISLLSMSILYFLVSRIYGRWVGLFTAFSWVVLPYAIFIEAAGYVDRDGVSMLLITCGALVFHLSRDWKMRLGKYEVGWLLGSLAVLAVALTLYVEWLYLGPLILLIILAASFLSEIAARYLMQLWYRFSRIEEELDPVDVGFDMAKVSPTYIMNAFRQSPWRSFSVIGLVCVIGGGASMGFSGMWTTIVAHGRDILAGGSDVAELQGLGLGSLLALVGFLVVPMTIGMYRLIVRRSRADLYFLSWFFCLFLLGLFAGRLFIYAAPTICITSGIGLATLAEPSPGRETLQVGKRCALVLMVVLLVAFSIPSAYRLASNDRVAASSNWYDALRFLRSNSSENSFVMTWWDRGYWVLDLARRKPVVDNGLHPEEVDRDIANVYCAKDDRDAVNLMEKHGATYLILSKGDLAVMPIITNLASGESYGDGKTLPWQMQDSLYARALFTDFEPNEFFDVFYRNEEVVILVVAGSG